MVVLMSWMFAALAAGAPSPEDEIVRAEWNREPASAFAAFLVHEDPLVRARAARAVGRLQSADGLAALGKLTDDPDFRVQREVAFALGITPGGAVAIREWLDRLPNRSTWGAPSRADELRASLVESLGRNGGPEDVPRLIAATTGATSVAAAHALARFGRRNVEKTDTAVPALVMMLERLDPEVVEAAAYALRRVTMKTASPADIDKAALRADTAPTPSARAWLITASWAPSPLATRAKLFDAAVADPSPLVRIAALDQVKPGDVPADTVAPLAQERDEGVRAAAIGALGRLATPAAIAALNALHPPDGAHLADRDRAAIAGGQPPDLDAARDARGDPMARAAIVEAIRDVPVLLALCWDDAVLVRSAAASTLVEQKLPVPESAALKLLESGDMVVRQAAIDRLAALDAPSSDKKKAGTKLSRGAIAAVLAALRVDTDPDVLATGFELLAAHTRQWKGDLDVRDGLLRDTLIRGRGHPDVAVRTAAAHLEQASGVTVGDVPRRTDIPYTDLRRARATVGATVLTTRGSFTIELLPDVAPLAVANFAQLGESHFWDGVAFHRVVPGFVIQTGDPRGDGSGGPGYTIPDEVSPLDYRHGAVGMARSGPDTGGSQWFVTTSNQPHLTGDYTLFGYVTSGLSVVDAIERGDRVLGVRVDRIEPGP